MYNDPYKRNMEIFGNMQEIAYEKKCRKRDLDELKIEDLKGLRSDLEDWIGEFAGLHAEEIIKKNKHPDEVGKISSRYLGDSFMGDLFKEAYTELEKRISEREKYDTK